MRIPRSIAGVPITRIGRLTLGAGITLVDNAGRERPLKPGGWEHFAKKSQ
jgi:thiamine monophosphate kinase